MIDCTTVAEWNHQPLGGTADITGWDTANTVTGGIFGVDG